MLWHLLRMMVDTIFKIKKRGKSETTPFPHSNTALWNESAWFLGCLYFFFFFFLSFILFLAGTSHLGERTFTCRVQHLGPFCKRPKRNVFWLLRKQWWCLKGNGMSDRKLRTRNDIQLCIIKTPINIHHKVQKTWSLQEAAGPNGGLRSELKMV